MASMSIGEAINIAIAPKTRRVRICAARSKAAVLRGSLEAGTFEQEFFQQISFKERDRLGSVFEAMKREGGRLRRAAAEGRRLSDREQLLTSLRTTTGAIFNKLIQLAARNGGAVFPSYDQLAEWLDVGRATVARAIDLLCRLQLLFRQRRFKIGDDTDGARYKQTSNAYRVFLPPWAESLLPRRLRSAPAPDDVVQREQDRIVEQANMLRRLSPTEYVKAVVREDSLAAVLLSFGAALECQARCESHDDPQRALESNLYGNIGRATREVE